MTEKHTLRAFDDALQTLSSNISTMGQMVADMVDAVGPVFCEGRVDEAKSLVRQDLEIDRQHDAIKAAVLEVLYRFHPVARDLRQVLAIEHIAANLERIADHSKSIAKRAIANTTPATSDGAVDILDQLLRAVAEALRDAMRALADGDASLAGRVCRGDGRIDQMYDDLFHTVVANLRTSQNSALGDVQVLFVGKSLERIGDHATNIAEEVCFMTKGDLPSATREV